MGLARNRRQPGDSVLHRRRERHQLRRRRIQPSHPLINVPQVTSANTGSSHCAVYHSHRRIHGAPTLGPPVVGAVHVNLLTIAVHLVSAIATEHRRQWCRSVGRAQLDRAGMSWMIESEGRFWGWTYR